MEIRATIVENNERTIFNNNGPMHFSEFIMIDEKDSKKSYLMQLIHSKDGLSFAFKEIGPENVRKKSDTVH